MPRGPEGLGGLEGRRRAAQQCLEPGAGSGSCRVPGRVLVSPQCGAGPSQERAGSSLHGLPGVPSHRPMS